MPEPIALCLERLGNDEEQATPYTQCVAIPGRGQGLAVAESGDIEWYPKGQVAFGLEVSMDDQLLLVRVAGAPKVTVHRLGRSLDLEVDIPAVLLDGDEVTVADHVRFCVHIHGTAPQVSPPRPLVLDDEPMAEEDHESAPARAGTLTRMAAAAVIGAAGVLGATGCPQETQRDQPVEVRPSPPAVPPPEDPPPPGPDADVPQPTKTDEGGALVTTKAVDAGKAPSKRPTKADAASPPAVTKRPPDRPIKVRPRPPRMAIPDPLGPSDRNKNRK